MKEIWKDIKGYEGQCQISNLGRVKSLNYGKTKQERLLKQSTNHKGYKRVSIRKGKVRIYSVHRLVAEAFINNPNNLPQVNHKDENKENNIVTNLEWCTEKENTRYSRALRVARIEILSGKIKEYEAVRDVANDGFNVSAVARCCRNRRGTYKGYVWLYIRGCQNERAK